VPHGHTEWKVRFAEEDVTTAWWVNGVPFSPTLDAGDGVMYGIIGEAHVDSAERLGKQELSRAMILNVCYKL
jgi:hypothetical protein